MFCFLIMLFISKNSLFCLYYSLFCSNQSNKRFFCTNFQIKKIYNQEILHAKMFNNQNTNEAFVVIVF